MSGGLRRCILLLAAWGVVVQVWAGTRCEGQQTVEMEMVYRYSEEFKALKGGQVAGHDWPAGSMEQHEHLIRRDRLRHAARGRGLLASSLSPSNETIELEVLGGLHYALITIGTPGLTFLVALDTGSDLLWVPCNCQQCSPTSWDVYGLQIQGLAFSVYNQSNSNTSKYLPCTDSLCSSSLTSTTSSCSSASERCNYIVKYMSTDTSTSGVIIEDLLHLNYETSSGSSISTPIYFGCSQLQTGDLVEGVAPDGLFGLGPDSISVPSTLARNGIVSTNSFSMCFSPSDSSGRLVFGSEAKLELPSTPLVAISPSVYYIVKTTKFSIAGDSLSVTENMIFDTGTSYTTLPQATYDSIGELLNTKITLPKFQLNGTFDYCWNSSDSNILNSLPELIITFSGGKTWNIVDPYLAFTTTRGDLVFFCLGITPNSIGIIGHNFMRGFEFFFNQGSMTFSWAPSTCYNLNASTAGSPQAEPSIVNRSSKQSSSAESHRAALYNALLFFNIFVLFITYILLL